jgi:hypothetical protein
VINTSTPLALSGGWIFRVGDSRFLITDQWLETKLPLTLAAQGMEEDANDADVYWELDEDDTVWKDGEQAQLIAPFGPIWYATITPMDTAMHDATAGQTAHNALFDQCR